MIDAIWTHVFQQIPEEQRGALSIVTVSGSELVVQQIYKMERDFMVVRARTAGTLDAGRIVVLAFSQIDFLAFNNKLGEPEVTEMFREPPPEIAAPHYVQPVITRQSSVIPAPTPRPSTASPAPASPSSTTPLPNIPASDSTDGSGAKPGQISKTILLARLRERLAEKAK